MIGSALVGTFLGVFLAYGLVGPFAAKLKTVIEEDSHFYQLIREVLVANLHRHAPGDLHRGRPPEHAPALPAQLCRPRGGAEIDEGRRMIGRVLTLVLCIGDLASAARRWPRPSRCARASMASFTRLVFLIPEGTAVAAGPRSARAMACGSRARPRSRRTASSAGSIATGWPTLGRGPRRRRPRARLRCHSMRSSTALAHWSSTSSTARPTPGPNSRPR